MVLGISTIVMGSSVDARCTSDSNRSQLRFIATDEGTDSANELLTRKQQGEGVVWLGHGHTISIKSHQD